MQHLKRHPWTIVWAITTAALAIALVGQTASLRTRHSAEAEGLHFTWRFHPKSLQEARDKAHHVVLVTVLSAERMEDLVYPVAGEPNGVVHLPAQRVTLRVTKVYRGEATIGQTVTVFQMGGSTDIQPDPHFAHDDPRYKPGERYVLLLA